jgi:hypothetical protein
MILSILLGSYSFALAQGASTPGSSSAPEQSSGVATGSAVNSATSTGATNSGTTGNAAGSQGGNPTNALDDNRVAPTTGNPLIQSGKIK